MRVEDRPRGTERCDLCFYDDASSKNALLCFGFTKNLCLHASLLKTTSCFYGDGNSAAVISTPGREPPPPTRPNPSLHLLRRRRRRSCGRRREARRVLGFHMKSLLRKQTPAHTADKTCTNQTRRPVGRGPMACGGGHPATGWSRRSFSRKTTETKPQKYTIKY